MGELQHITFDFSGENGVQDLSKLEEILSSGHWSDRGFDYEDGRVALLIHLLQCGGIQLYKGDYAPVADISPELWRRAQELADLMNKRDASATLAAIAERFSKYENDVQKMVYNSLYFPEIKAFVRCGGLPPDKLLTLLEQDGCDAVLLFPDYYGEEFFYAFVRAMPRENFLGAMEEEREETLAAMSEALHRLETSGAFPTFPVPPVLGEVGEDSE